MDDSNKVDHSVEVNEMVAWLREGLDNNNNVGEMMDSAADLLERTEAKRVELEALLDRFINTWAISTDWGSITMANNGELNAIKQKYLDAREGGE